MKHYKIQVILIGTLLIASYLLLGPDVIDLFKWYGMTVLFGTFGYGLSQRFFTAFIDQGWIWSKTVCIAISGYICWLFPALHLQPFSKSYTIGITILTCGILFLFTIKSSTKKPPISTILWEEIGFFALFLVWLYFAGFDPSLRGVEKPMDYGFMASIQRAVYFPPADIWWGGEPLNYYYGGQYFAVYLSRIAGVPIEKGYHLMKAFLAANAGIVPAILCIQMLKDSHKKTGVRILGGFISGISVSLCGNFHYVLYGLFGWDKNYTYSRSTRFIGYVPDTADKTIHEFPAYSFLLGDLHAHVANTMFVFLFLGLLYAWYKSAEKIEWKYPIACGSILGLFIMTNTWDWAIYLVVGCGISLFWVWERKSQHKIKIIGLTWLCMCGASLLIAAPFLYQFNSSSAAQGIALATTHSKPWQLLVLWGLPMGMSVLFIIRYVINKKSITDTYVLILLLCAIGLVITPEILYVRDIYEQGYPRCNTMFKLTYQAFILFGTMMGYICIQSLASKQKSLHTAARIGLCLLILTTGYFPQGLKDAYKIGTKGEYTTIDGLQYRKSQADGNLIQWLNTEISGQPILLTADGESYSRYSYISALTGIPTVLGWHTHEWLWRGSYENVQNRSKDIKTIYTSKDQNEVASLLDQYAVDYILISDAEKSRYQKVNEILLRSLGTIVYEDENNIVIHYQ